MSKNIRSIENRMLWNITIICSFLVLFLSFLFIGGWLFEGKSDLEFLASSIWVILAFWYWYKKYERDKEIEMIDKLSLKENIDELIIDWKARRVIYEKWYIKDYLWNIIESNYQIKFQEHIWILKDINYEDDLIIDMWLMISKLMTYEWAKDYFLKQVELIEKVLECQAIFYRKLNEEKYILKINYYERLKVKVWENKLSIINASNL